jgi:transposase
MIYAKIGENDLLFMEKEMNLTTDASWYRRLKIIHLSSQHRKTAPELASLFDLCQATIRSYIHAYNTDGLDGLKRKFSPGCPAQTDLTKAEWEELLKQSPSQFDKLNTAARNWTQSLLVKYCAAYLNVNITQGGISSLFKRLGVRWNRGKLKVTSPDPLYMVKRERIDTLKKS